MGKVVVLRREEGVRMDLDRLCTLRARIGLAAADAVIRRARGELAACLERLARLGGDPRWIDFGDTADCARRIAGCARQIGLTSLAHVASDVAACARGCDGPALAATLARLLRIGDRSLAETLDSRGLSG